jgi:hypothetical protein
MCRKKIQMKKCFRLSRAGMWGDKLAGNWEEANGIRSICIYCWWSL